MDNGYNVHKLLYNSNEIEGKNIEIELNYKINKNDENSGGEGEEENTIKLFGEDFAKKNSDLCTIIHGEEKTDLTDKIYLFDEDKQKDIFTIKLRGINNLNNFFNMFENCSNLISVNGLSKVDTSKVIRMTGMFSSCNSLESIDDISCWNTANTTSISFMFGGCQSLKSLPDIGKWNLSNCTDFGFIFQGCSSLTSLPDISGLGYKKC